MSVIRFEIPGVPVGKGRPRFARRGKHVATYTPEKTASYESLVKICAAQAMHNTLLIEGPVWVQIALWVTPPQSWSDRKRRDAINGLSFPTSKPDIDNTVKLLMDACNEIVWKDDKQVVNLTVAKRYGDKAHVAMMIHD